MTPEHHEAEDAPDNSGHPTAKHPEKREAMLKFWDEYVKTNGVIVSDAGPFAKREP